MVQACPLNHAHALQGTPPDPGQFRCARLPSGTQGNRKAGSPEAVWCWYTGCGPLSGVSGPWPCFRCAPETGRARKVATLHFTEAGTRKASYHLPRTYASRSYQVNTFIRIHVRIASHYCHCRARRCRCFRVRVWLPVSGPHRKPEKSVSGPTLLFP